MEDLILNHVEDNNAFILGEDPVRRIRRLFHFDEATGHATIQTQQVLDDVLAANQRARVDDTGSWKGLRHQVASIPISVWHDLPDEVRNDHKALRVWLEKSENEVFRTKSGGLV